MPALFKISFLNCLGMLILAHTGLLLADEASIKLLRDRLTTLEQENLKLRAELEQLQKQDKRLKDTTKVKKDSSLKKPDPWSGNISVGGTFDRGNSEDENFTFSGEVNHKTKSDLLSNNLNLSFGRSRGTTSTQRATQATQYDHNLDTRWYDLLHEAANYDRLAGVQYRIIAGPGVGYYLIKGKDFYLNAELGIMGEYEKLRNQSADPTPRLLLASNFNETLSPTTRLYGNVEVLPDLLDTSQYLFDAHLNLETQIYKPFFLKFSINDLYNSAPPVGSERNDLNAVSALVWKF